MRHADSILFGALFTAATAWSLGRIAFRRLGLATGGLDRNLLAGFVGAALLSLAIFLICALQIAYVGTFLVLGLLLLWLNYRQGREGGERAARFPWWWIGIFAVYAYVYLVNAVAPEHSPDGQTYHLGLVYRFFRAHGFQRITTSFYANMPLAAEMLFLDAFAFGRQSAAATLEFCGLAALPFLMAGYGRRIGAPTAGLVAALLVFLSPIAGYTGSTAYNDMMLTGASFATFYLVEVWREDQENTGLAVAIGLTAGFCFAIKYTGFPAPLYAALVMLWHRRPRALVTMATAGALIAGPWLAKNWISVGNPLSPFFNRWFPNPYVHVGFEEYTRAWFRRYDIADLRPLFWMVTVSGRIGGQLGPWFLLAPIALIAAMWKQGRYLLLAGIIFLIPYPQNISARFVLPALPFIALAMSLALARSRVLSGLVVAAATVLAWPTITEKYEVPGNLRITNVPLKAALRKIPQDQFLAERSVPWITGQTLDTFVPPGNRILSTTPVGEAYSKSDVMVTYQSGEGEILQDLLTIATQDGLVSTWNHRFRFPTVRTSQLRIQQNAPHPEDVWSIGEVKAFEGEQPIQVASLDARPYPFDLAYMLDGNPLTRWKAWEPMRAGTWVDVYFAAGTRVDRVEVHCSHDQSRTSMQLQACDGNSCRNLETKLEKMDDPALGDLRKAATREIRKRGVSYLLMDDGNWVAADIKADPGRWSMSFIAERAGNRLYVLH